MVLLLIMFIILGHYCFIFWWNMGLAHSNGCCQDTHNLRMIRTPLAHLAFIGWTISSVTRLLVAVKRITITHSHIPSLLMHTLLAIWLLINKRHVGRDMQQRPYIFSHFNIYIYIFWEHMRRMAIWLVFPSSRGNISRSENQTILFWVPLHYHPVLQGHLKLLTIFSQCILILLKEDTHDATWKVGRDEPLLDRLNMEGLFFVQPIFLFSCMIASNDHTLNNLLSHRV